MPHKVYLRKKSISKERETLYLDFWPPITHPRKGHATRREFLRMHILKNPKSMRDIIYNNEKIALAKSIRNQRDIQINNLNNYTNERP